MSLSDRVYNMLVENAKRPVQNRATIVERGGAIDSNWRDDKLTGYDVEAAISDSRNRYKKPKKRHTVPKTNITSFDIEQTAEPIDYMEDDEEEERGGNCCSMCGAVCPMCNYGGNKRNYGGNKQTMCGGKRKLNSGLRDYQEKLNNIKAKGYTHKEAQDIMRQLKSEFGDDMAGGKHGRNTRRFFKDFGKGFVKGFTGAAKIGLPLLL